MAFRIRKAMVSGRTGGLLLCLAWLAGCENPDETRDDVQPPSSPSELAGVECTPHAAVRSLVQLSAEQRADLRMLFGNDEYEVALASDCQRLARQGSGMVSSMVGVHALIELDKDIGDIAKGERAPALLLEIL